MRCRNRRCRPRRGEINDKQNFIKFHLLRRTHARTSSLTPSENTLPRTTRASVPTVLEDVSGARLPSMHSADAHLGQTPVGETARFSSEDVTDAPNRGIESTFSSQSLTEAQQSYQHSDPTLLRSTTHEDFPVDPDVVEPTGWFQKCWRNTMSVLYIVYAMIKGAFRNLVTWMMHVSRDYRYVAVKLRHEKRLMKREKLRQEKDKIEQEDQTIAPVMASGAAIETNDVTLQVNVRTSTSAQSLVEQPPNMFSYYPDEPETPTQDERDASVRRNSQGDAENADIECWYDC